jgi:hypothetical protein
MTPERVKEINGLIGKRMAVELARDFVSRGPQYVQDLISEIRGYLNEASHYMQDVHEEKAEFEMELDARETAFQIAFDEHLTENKQVTMLPNIDDRRAMINKILKNERLEMRRVGREIKNLGHVEKSIRLRQKELDKTVSEIRLKKSFMDSQWKTGAFYGDESDTSRGNKWKVSPTSPDISIDEDDALLDTAIARLYEDDSGEDLKCSVCGEPQFETPHGTTCKNGHGGAPGAPSEPDTVEDPPEASKAPSKLDIVKNLPETSSEVDDVAGDLLEGLEDISEPAQAASDDDDDEVDPDILRFLKSDDDEVDEDDMAAIFADV